MKVHLIQMKKTILDSMKGNWWIALLIGTVCIGIGVSIIGLVQGIQNGNGKLIKVFVVFLCFAVLLFIASIFCITNEKNRN